MNYLSPFGMIYGRVMDVRNWLYDRGILPSHHLGAKTISIGNLTAGGTGKTPLVALAARILAESGEKVCVLTRGYGRANEKKRVLVSDGESVLADALKGGDEPVELARKLIGKAVVIADGDRVAAAKWAKDRFGITAFVLDDGFQHRRARRDLDVVCVDATAPFGDGVIPAGTARERIRNMRRADAVVITRADLASDIDDLRSRISEYSPGSPVFTASNLISGILPLAEYLAGVPKQGRRGLRAEWKMLRAEGQPDDPDEEVRLLAFCGLGNPENFFLSLEEQFEREGVDEFRLLAVKAFPDHYYYNQWDIDRLVELAGDRIDAMITTAKDAVKLKDLKFEIPCYVVEIEPRLDDETALSEMILSS